ncbi:MAG: HEAT repeat domain-containing protein [Gammaproteobacteria bacterium]|nr:HEAT repeat domain-containing protein [Woeseia sp.]MBT8435065.1 HEAT repeat domain-containing protein [Gammaproteobacteria bacterium]
MIKKTGIPPIDKVLRQIENAGGRDEIEETSGLLSLVTPHYIDELIANYDSYGYTNYFLVTSLGGETSAQAMPLFEKAIKDKNRDVRYAAALVLSRYRTRKASKLLVDALKDRCGFVKFIAVTAMSKFRDPDAVPQLKKIIQSEYQQRTSPGTVERAKKALERCGGKL